MTDNRGYKEEYSKDFVGYWDELIGWEGRARAEEGFFQRLLTAHGAKSVIDAACGTGFHSVTLARDGFEVTASDGSENMLARALENANRHGVTFAAARVADWRRLHEVHGEASFDALICLGNAFTHLFEHEDRREAMHAMYSVLKPGGMIVIDHRNYDRMLDHGYSSKHMYYYTGEGVKARPIVVNRTLTHFEYVFADGETFHLRLYPLKQGYMRHLLEEAGFHDVATYGDFERPFDEAEVDFMQQVAFRPRRNGGAAKSGNGKAPVNGNGNGRAH